MFLISLKLDSVDLLVAMNMLQKRPFKFDEENAKDIASKIS